LRSIGWWSSTRWRIGGGRDGHRSPLIQQRIELEGGSIQRGRVDEMALVLLEHSAIEQRLGVRELVLAVR